MLLSKIETTIVLDLLFDIIFIIKWINVLLANINKMFLITDIDYVFLKILLLINLILSLFLLLILT